MAKYKFLYLDDENDASTEAIVDGLKIDDIIDVISDEPKDFKDQITDLKRRINDFDGLILDLRLDGKKLDISYNAPAIAQELRMISAEGGIKSFPIILCSTDEKMKATYEVEKICLEHFDYKFTKQTSPPWKKFATKLAALAKGYQYLNDAKYDINKVINRNDVTSIDTRVLEMFTGYEKPFPIYDFASFVIKDLFNQPGVLINEGLLAARLGIDITKSEDWQNLINGFFSKSVYYGVFSDGWRRWWADKVLSAFKEATHGKRLSMLNAVERVKILTEITGLKDLVAATPLEYSKSTNFWTICEYYKAPLDPLEGFKIHSTTEPKSWQENRYISLLAALKKKGPRPHSSEVSRIQSIKENFTKK